MKVIIDTNILISAAFRGGKPKMAIAHVIASSSFEWIATSEIIKEYKEVLNRPKLKLSQITKQEWLELIDLKEGNREQRVFTNHLELLYLITGDDDLLILQPGSSDRIYNNFINPACSK